MRKALIASFFPMLAIIAGFVFLSFTSRHSQSESDNVPVGTVIYSLIPPTQFMKLNEGWALLDGTQMSADWQLSKTINATGILQNLGGKLPDASGMFFRAMNYNNKGADPSERLVGSKQWDAIEAHHHAINMNTEAESYGHSHEIDAKLYGIVQRNDHNSSRSPDPNGDGRYLKDVKLELYGGDDEWLISKPISSFDKHSHKIKYTGTTGGATRKGQTQEITTTESRPVNIALYVYIKVN